MRNVSSTISKRDFTDISSRRDFTGLFSRRTFTVSTSRRDFGAVTILGWKTWGQEDIHPFDYPTGVDSGKTFGELP
jgi:hypothetical protein